MKKLLALVFFLSASPVAAQQVVPVQSGEVYVAEIAGFAPVQVAFEDGAST